MQNLIVDQYGQPTDLTRVASHALVGVLATYVAHQMFHNEVATFAAPFVAIALHEWMDAPVADLIVALA